MLGVFCRRWGVPLIDGGTVRLPRIVGLGRALDLILTGRAVGAEEALAIGLANRVVRARPGAAPRPRRWPPRSPRFPQACLRSDRASVYAALGQARGRRAGRRVRPGRASLRAEGAAGAQRFAAGAGRHGQF